MYIQRNILNTGSIYLLFETADALININNLTTECELLFGEDSYGLIKNVNKGIRIDKINSNLTMNILGNTLVDSSLMF